MRRAACSSTAHQARVGAAAPRKVGDPSRVLAALCKLPVGFFFLAAVPMALPLMPALERHALLQRAALIRVLVAHAPAVLLALLVAGVALTRVHRGQSGLQDLVGIGIGRYGSIADRSAAPHPEGRAHRAVVVADGGRGTDRAGCRCAAEWLAREVPQGPLVHRRTDFNTLSDGARATVIRRPRTSC